MVLRNARKKLGYSQSQIAQKIGTTQQTYCRWENLQVEPSIKKISELSRILQVSKSEIINEYEDR